MSDILKVAESIRIPHFFRDILFLSGGILIIPLVTFYILDYEPLVFFGKAKFLFELDTNFFAMLFFLSTAYLAGRLSDMIADTVYNILKFLFKIFPMRFERDQKNNRVTYYIQFKRAYCELVGIKFRKNPLQRIVNKTSINWARITSYIQENKYFGDNLERSVYSDIIHSHIFCVSVVLTYFETPVFLILSCFMLFKKYQSEGSEHFNEVEKEILRVQEYEKEREEINRELSASDIAS